MAIKFEKIKPGMRLYDVRRNRGWGRNKWDVWPVDVISVDEEKRTAVARWNHNEPEEMGEYRITKYRAKQPKED